MGYIEYPIGKPNYNTDSVAKTLTVDAAQNCYYENTGEGNYAIRRRPGYELFVNPTAGEVILGPKGQGIFWSDRFQAVFAVVNGRLFKIMDAVGTLTELPGDGFTMNAQNPVTFAEGQDLATVPYIYIGHGGRLVYTDGASLLSPSDTATPGSSRFVTFANVRFYATNGGQDFWITDTNPSTGYLDVHYWSGTGNPWRAALRSDNLSAVVAMRDEIAMVGERSIEYWQEDGSNPISPLIGATTEAGALAAHTVKITENTLYFLADVGGKRAVIKLDDRSPYILSDPIDRMLQEMTVVEDAIANLVFVGGLNFYVIYFPTEAKTWAYDIKEGIWSEWGQWDTATATHQPLKIVGTCFAKTWGKYLLMGDDGKIYTFSRNVFQDAGTTIRTLVRTGWLNHGTNKRKRSNALFLRVKAYSATAGSLLYRFRDDGRPEWSSHIEVPLGSESQEQHINVMRRGGIYRSRQYEFQVTDNIDLALVSLGEDVTSLRD